MNKLQWDTNTTIVNDDDTLEFLALLNNRWLDEQKYEDWEDYEAKMKEEIELPEGCEFIKATDFPFGFRFKLENNTFAVFLNKKAKGVNLKSKFIK